MPAQTTLGKYQVFVRMIMAKTVISQKFNHRQNNPTWWGQTGASVDHNAVQIYIYMKIYRYISEDIYLISETDTGTG